MIQRIQTVWLLLAGAAAACMFFLNMFTVSYTQAGAEVVKDIPLFYNYLLSIFGFTLVAIPLIALTQFKKRKAQMGMAVITIILNLLFVALYIMDTQNYGSHIGQSVSSLAYGAGSFMPVVSIIFLILAIRGIRKDQKLVKSLDRLR